MVLRQTLLFVIDRELGQAHDQRAGLGGARVHRVPRAVRNLWKKCQDCHRTASGRSATPPGKKYSDLRGAITKSPTLTIGNGINTITKEHLFLNVFVVLVHLVNIFTLKLHYIDILLYCLHWLLNSVLLAKNVSLLGIILEYY